MKVKATPKLVARPLNVAGPTAEKPDLVRVSVYSADGELMRNMCMERYTATMFSAFQSIYTHTSVVIRELSAK